MRIGAAFGAGILGGLVIVACGSSSSDGGSAANACTPGASVACTGAGGCSGGQVCNASGTAYGDCVCGAGTDGGSNDASTIDSGSTDAGVDSGLAFTPKTLSGLVLWVDGSDVDPPDGGTVTNWPDQADGGHTLGSSSTIYPPTQASFDSHGNNSVVFNSGVGPSRGPAVVGGSADFAAIGTDDFLVEIVLAAGPTGTVWQFANGPSAAPAELLFSASGGTATVTLNDGAENHTATYASGAHIFGFRRTSTTEIEIRVDGTPTAATIASLDLTNQQYFQIGKDFSDGFAGTVAEAIIVHAPSDADVSTLETYLKSKYGL